MRSDLMDGETVTVELRQDTTDRFGNTAAGYDDPVEVSGVLVADATADDMSVERPDGINVTTTMAFPRTFDGDLRGARITTAAGRVLRVSGAPAHVASPLDAWDMTVQAGEVDG